MTEYLIINALKTIIMNRSGIKTAKWKVFCASASGFRRDFDWQLNEHVIMVIQLSRLTVDSSTYT